MNIENAISCLPEHMRESARAYVMEGQSPNDEFLQAVLENDLHKAAALADDVNVLALKDWARFLHEAPVMAWGCRDRIDRWIRLGGIKGANARIKDRTNAAP